MGPSRAQRVSQQSRKADTPAHPIAEGRASPRFHDRIADQGNAIGARTMAYEEMRYAQLPVKICASAEQGACRGQRKQEERWPLAPRGVSSGLSEMFRACKDPAWATALAQDQTPMVNIYRLQGTAKRVACADEGPSLTDRYLVPRPVMVEGRLPPGRAHAAPRTLLLENFH
eukprot:6193515-Pleurochrysis_carterae.AAC.2